MIDIGTVLPFLPAVAIALASIGYVKMQKNMLLKDMPSARSFVEAKKDRLPVIFDIDMDSDGTVRVLEKENTGDTFYRISDKKLDQKKDGKELYFKNTILDRAQFDTMPLMLVDGVRTFLRASKSATTNTPCEADAIQQCYMFVYDNPNAYPWLSQLQPFEIMECLSYPLKTVEELMARRSVPEDDAVDEEGNYRKRTEEEIKKLTIQNTQTYMREVKAFRDDVTKALPKDMFIDVPAAVDATQMRCTKNLVEAIEVAIRGYYQSRLDKDAKSEFWRGAALGLIGGIISVAVIFIVFKQVIGV